MDSTALMQRQNEILQEMTELRAMKKGTVTFQRFKPKPGADDAAGAAYPVFTWKERGRTKGMRLKSEQEVAWAQQAVGRYKRFTVLCREYEELAEQLALLERDPQDGAHERALKKGLKSRRPGARK